MTDILVVDDEKDIRELVSDILEDEGYGTRQASNSDEVQAEVRAATPALIILDIWLKDSALDGIDILKWVKTHHPDVPVVIISGHGNIEIAVAAIKQGAYDFIEKPFNIDQLTVVIRRAMEASQLRRENSKLRHRDQSPTEMIGESTAFKQLKIKLDKVTKTNGRVLLSGPAGVGKELAARFIHRASSRASGNFIVVNSASIDASRMEEVLFGRESAQSGVQAGLLEDADGGIIYFDEISDMPIDTQSKILRVLVDQKFRRVGGQELLSVDLRVISSTSKNLLDLIAQGKFREELYHRLNVVPIAVPSLEERREDIELLANHFIEYFNKNEGLTHRRFDNDAITALTVMRWPGNVRELRNLVERALILCDGNDVIGVDDLPVRDSSNGVVSDEVAPIGDLTALPLREAREQFEREYLLAQINRFSGNISRTASFIGMERSALHRKLKSLGVVTGAKGSGRMAYIAGSDETAAQ